MLVCDLRLPLNDVFSHFLCKRLICVGTSKGETVHCFITLAICSGDEMEVNIDDIL